ncbi:hypothetical protein LTR84_000315 [Exophiala bonariae]|uniref:GPI anchored serine-threonine rich protein n=1 Tax=Exophiala bonariae TaxID=1690606 RepID=A0AAV9NQK9_9EURO|nr:hypothetical protein LTR84_000315 [Exophiala bonariae]
MRSFFFLAALPLLVSAWNENVLLGRATSGNATQCASGDAVCGEFCIPSTYTCCPDLEGGCAANTECQKGGNGVYGCCPTGNTCTGDGGAEFLDDGSSSSSSSTATTSSGAATKTGSSGNDAGALVLSKGGVVAAAVAAGLLLGF